MKPESRPKSDSYYYDDTSDRHLRDPDDELSWYPGLRKALIFGVLLVLTALAFAYL